MPVVEQVVEKHLLPKCGFDIDTRIFGGKRSSIGDFPWLALLRYSKRESQNENSLRNECLKNQLFFDFSWIFAKF